MKCNFEHWPLLTRSLYGYRKEINITPFQLLSQLSDSRYFSLCKCAPLLAHSFFLWLNRKKKKENNGSVFHQLPLKAPLGDESGNYLFPLQEWPSDGFYVVCIKPFTLVSFAFIHHRLIWSDLKTNEDRMLWQNPGTSKREFAAILNTVKKMYMLFYLPCN